MSGLPPGRPEAAESIWRWRAPSAADSGEASEGRARLTGSLQASIGLASAAAIYILWSATVAAVVLCVSTLVLVSALASPKGLYRFIQGLLAALGSATGRALTWLTLVPLFYLFFLPFGLLLRRGRRDRLKRFFEPGAKTYWEPHRPFSAADHERQF